MKSCSRRRLLRGGALAAALWSAIAVRAQTIDHSGGFDDDSDITENGSAAAIQSVLRLTDGGQFEAGSVFATQPVGIRRFTTTYTFQQRVYTTYLADGLTFTIQNISPFALGAAGGALGYGADLPGFTLGMARSLCIKWDIFGNAGEGFNSTGLYQDGASPTVPAITLDGTGIMLISQHPFSVTTTYNNPALTVTIRDTVTGATATQNYTIDIPRVVGGETAYVGFTGATGGLTSIQEIQTWRWDTQ